MDYNYSEFLIETEVPEGEVIISRTDLEGIITHANDVFSKISGYSVDELIGKPHNILRHPDMPKSAFAHMWQSIQNGETWQGYVKNMRKDGGFYWVFAEISGVHKNGELVEYKSIRSPISRAKVLEMQKKYDAIKLAEKDTIRVVHYLSYNEYQKRALHIKG